MNNDHLTIFLDLEETIIDEWGQRNFLSQNADAISTFIKETVYTLSPTILKFGVMSWAIWDDDDKEEFNSMLRTPIENALGISFSSELIWSLEHWHTLINKNSKIHMNRDDLFDFCHKENTLFWLRNAPEEDFPTGYVFLIDDTVTHGDTINSASREITFININDLTENYSR